MSCRDPPVISVSDQCENLLARWRQKTLPFMMAALKFELLNFGL